MSGLTAVRREGSLLRRKGKAEAWKRKERAPESEEVHATACVPPAGREQAGTEEGRDLDVGGAQPGKERSRVEEHSWGRAGAGEAA